MYLDEFIVDEKWNEFKLSKFFGKEMVDIIKSVNIHSELQNDQLELLYKYSGKSISALASAKQYEDCDEVKYWTWIRKLKLRPWVELFWWRLNNNVIPSNDFLMYRRLLDCNACPRGCNSVENAEHIIVSCDKLRPVIQVLKLWGFAMPVFYSLNDCNKIMEKLSTTDPFIGNMYCSAVFFSWKSRNKIKHGGNEDGYVFVAANEVNFVVALFTFNLYSKNWGANQLHQLSHSYWHPPPPEWIKVNIDASLLRSNKSGIGGVFRDCKGRFLLAFGFSSFHWDISQLLMLAITSLKKFVQDWKLDAKGRLLGTDVDGCCSGIWKKEGGGYLQQGSDREQGREVHEVYEAFGHEVGVREWFRLCEEEVKKSSWISAEGGEAECGRRKAGACGFLAR
ncbi:hypothetical protein M5K25_002463 [Dendrobium thyrsiflorum]|uniref:Reverse transcriptase zinc-binding domain-containing protein n=1 Tax=Dendrobium thyrsiflorum TaxID=117978 RepID=A0ABD0VMS5_DENTH